MKNEKMIQNFNLLIKKVSDDCRTCQIYKKAPPHPIIGLAMATSSNVLQ